LYHAWRTLAPTALGFFFGLALGFLLAAGIIYNRTLEKSLLPWIIISQTIPILAIAPMIIVVLAAINFTGLIPKAVISMYLSFFPVAISMVKGLRSPEPLQLDLMKTYRASPAQIFFKLRLAASLPFLFAGLKVAAAASLVGAIVGELPTGAQGGLGARLLSGSYYGQTVQIWAALVIAAALGAGLVYLVAGAQYLTMRKWRA
jgi:NitT/TauT family transport system permease protein